VAWGWGGGGAVIDGRRCGVGVEVGGGGEEEESGVVVVGTAVTSVMGVLVVGQRDECVRDDDEVCGQEMPLVCQWRTLLYSRARPATGVLVDCAPRLHGHELASPAHPPVAVPPAHPPLVNAPSGHPPVASCSRWSPPRPPSDARPAYPPLTVAVGSPVCPRAGSAALCRASRPPRNAPLQRVVPPPPTAAPVAAATNRHQNLQRPGGWVARSPAAGPRCPRSVDCRLAAPPPAVGGPPARSSPSPRKVRNRPLPTRDSHGRKMPVRRRADPPRAPPTARSQSGLCCRVGWGTPHPTPTCRWEGTPWVPCAGAGPSAGRVGPSGATSSASLAVATPRHPDGGAGSLGDTAASSEHGAWMHRRDENFACHPRDRIKSQMTMPLQGPLEGPCKLPPFSSRLEDGADHETVSSECRKSKRKHTTENGRKKKHAEHRHRAPLPAVLPPSAPTRSHWPPVPAADSARSSPRGGAGHPLPDHGDPRAAPPLRNNGVARRTTGAARSTQTPGARRRPAAPTCAARARGVGSL